MDAICLSRPCTYVNAVFSFTSISPRRAAARLGYANTYGYGCGHGAASLGHTDTDAYAYGCGCGCGYRYNYSSDGGLEYGYVESRIIMIFSAGARNWHGW